MITHEEDTYPTFTTMNIKKKIHQQRTTKIKKTFAGMKFVIFFMYYLHIWCESEKHDAVQCLKNT